MAPGAFCVVPSRRAPNHTRYAGLFFEETSNRAAGAARGKSLLTVDDGEMTDYNHL